MPKYHIWTIGCQMNKAESERLGSYFERLGYEASGSANEAELVVRRSMRLEPAGHRRLRRRLERRALQDSGADSRRRRHVHVAVRITTGVLRARPGATSLIVRRP